MRTSEVAAQANVNTQTLRYYERRGLLAAPARSPAGYRAYPPEAVRVVRVIKRAQRLGFTLADIEELTLVPTPHRFLITGRTLYTWCASDTLIFTIMLDRLVRVESTCPVTVLRHLRSRPGLARRASRRHGAPGR